MFSGTAASPRPGCLPWAPQALCEVGVLQQVTATQLFALELNPGMPDSGAKARLPVTFVQRHPHGKALDPPAGSSFLSRAGYLIEINKMFCWYFDT